MTSPAVSTAAESTRTEAEVRAIRARRASLEAEMRAEGAPDWMIQRNATDEAAARLIDYERRAVDFIGSMFGGAR